jgi:hypothetical protein
VHEQQNIASSARNMMVLNYHTKTTLPQGNYGQKLFQISLMGWYVLSKKGNEAERESFIKCPKIKTIIPQLLVNVGFSLVGYQKTL